MAGLVMTSVTRHVPFQAVHDNDQLVSEKIAAYWDFVSTCAKQDMFPMSDPDITLDVDFFGTTIVTVTGWAYISTAPVEMCLLEVPGHPTLFEMINFGTKRVG